jgi:hypothetical protein
VLYRNDLLGFRSGSYFGKVLVTVPALVPVPQIFSFFTFVLHFMLGPGPKPVPELKFITVPVPLSQKVPVPAVSVPAPAPQHWL